MRSTWHSILTFTLFFGQRDFSSWSSVVLFLRKVSPPVIIHPETSDTYNYVAEIFHFPPFFWQTKYCASTTLDAIKKQTESQQLFDTKLLNHIVMWSNTWQLTSVASCCTEMSVRLFKSQTSWIIVPCCSVPSPSLYIIILSSHSVLYILMEYSITV